jgi:hypothetical protein
MTIAELIQLLQKLEPTRRVSICGIDEHQLIVDIPGDNIVLIDHDSIMIDEPHTLIYGERDDEGWLHSV